MGDRLIAIPVPTQDNAENEDIHSCPECDSNTRSQRSKTFQALELAATEFGSKV
jgi:hypothetical protein